MDDDLHNPQNRHRRHQGWKFTFFGETPENQESKGNQIQLAAKLTQNELFFPLSSTQVGDCVVVSQILSGKSMVRQLSKQGLTLGAEVQVISKIASGSIIVSIRDRQIGLGAGMANKVMVMAADNNL
ncbi:MAG: ferrous iron transport protein A [Pleurocapsa sp.]